MSIEMKFTEHIITKKVPDKITFDLSIEQAVALKAVLDRVYSGNNYIFILNEHLSSVIGQIKSDYMFDNQNKLNMPHSSMELCNQEAARIRTKLTI